MPARRPPRPPRPPRRPGLAGPGRRATVTVADPSVARLDLKQPGHCPGPGAARPTGLPVRRAWAIHSRLIKFAGFRCGARGFTCTTLTVPDTVVALSHWVAV